MANYHSSIFFLKCAGILSSFLSFHVSAETPSHGAKPLPKYEYKNECGDSVMESSLWRVYDGVVTEIREDNSFVLKMDALSVRVSLAAIDTSKNNKFANVELNKILLNKKVTVLTNDNINSGRLVGVVWSQDQDVNRKLIEAGIAQYREPAAYSMSSHAACVYRIEERKAREAKKGMWKD